MTLMQGINLAKSYDQGLTYLFKNISFTIDEGKHIALVGANGSGKTTLLKMIAGVEDVNIGSVLTKKGLRIGYQRQEPVFGPDTLVRNLLEESFAELKLMKERMVELEFLMSQGEDLELVLEEYGKIQEIFEFLGGYTIDQEMVKVIKGLGLEEDDLQRPAVSLSGGEKSKVLLACQLLEKPDLLLLDEPTNHLDVKSLEWLEEFLDQYSGTFLVVSHDRYFLDQVAGEIWEIDRGELYQMSGNYSQYIEEKDRRLKAQWAEYEKQQRQLKTMNQQIQSFRTFGKKSEKNAGMITEGGMDKSFFKAKASKMMKKAKVVEAKRERLLNKDRVKKPWEERKIQIQFPVKLEAFGEIMHLKELSMAYKPEEWLFKNLNCSISADCRVGVIGSNGAGKTTLFKLILHELQPITGEVVQGNRVRIGYYSQEQETLDLEKSALENILMDCQVDETMIRTILGCLKLEKDKVLVPVKYLSGGEKSKVQLSKILLSGANLLLLDEPTNHLDIESREAIEEALLQYPGAMLFISHDRFFLQKLANQLININGGESRVHLGDYRSFRNKVQSEEGGSPSPEDMILETRLTALIGKLSHLREEQEEERVELEMEILALQRQKGVSSSGVG